MSVDLQTMREPIPGYTLLERIGAGGYGEVWKVDAPGGLAKAIKCVYGRMDDTRAARELKALDRVKQVRHPFLLSLERIEVVDGQLFIVTELADQSLKDRYDACREAGHPGIPRAELLSYIHDAADALDYMRELYSLQHLDIKPENLLLVGGHIKVADFGLVKQLQDVSVSLVGGLTPIYAAPEVFDDRASAQSDQYSLAIVYQEMLTGQLPFPGRTPAQLASQHLHSRPQLESLPLADQAVLARALAKDPSRRFASCRAMIDALCHAGQTGTAGARAAAGQPPSSAANVETTALGSRSTEPSVAVPADEQTDAARVASPPSLPARPRPRWSDDTAGGASSPSPATGASYTSSYSSSPSTAGSASAAPSSPAVPSSPASPSPPASPSSPASTDSSAALASRNVTEALPQSAQQAAVRAAALRVPGRGSGAAGEAGQPGAAAIVDLPPLDVSASDDVLRPTLFVGLGGTAGRVLAHLRGRLERRFGHDDPLPALGTLVFDTNPSALEALASGAGPRLARDELVALRLRSARDYREGSEQLLKWISRRWLYNIPRTLETEGLRPLGRLALIDHADLVRARLRAALQSISADSALAATGALSGLSFRNRVPRVFVVASISGGTGSGMAIDVGFMVRQVLAELGLPADVACGLLLHSTGRDPHAQELAIANSYACLSELYHYDQTGTRSGSGAAVAAAASSAASQAGSSAGAPAGSLDAIRQAAFGDTYLVHLGDSLDDDQYDAAARAVAAYLYLDATTATGLLLDRSREQARRTPREPAEALALRSFGLCSLRCDVRHIAADEIGQVCRTVLARWSGEWGSPHLAARGGHAQSHDSAPSGLPRRSTSNSSVALSASSTAVAARVAAALGVLYSPGSREASATVSAVVPANTAVAGTSADGEIDAARLIDHLASLALKCERGKWTARISGPPADAPAAGRSDSTVREGPAAALDRKLGPRGSATTTATSGSTAVAIAEVLREQSVVLSAATRQAVQLAADDPHGRLAAAAATAEQLRQQLTHLRQDVAALVAQAAAQLDGGAAPLDAQPRAARTGGWLARWRRAEEGDLEQRTALYVAWRVEEHVGLGLLDLLDAELARLDALANQSQAARRTVRKLLAGWSAPSAASAAADAEAEGDSPTEPSGQHDLTGTLQAFVQAARDTLVTEVDHRLSSELLAPRGGLLALGGNWEGLASVVEAAMRTAVEGEVERLIRHFDFMTLLVDARDSATPDESPLHACLAAALPAPLAGGGARRLAVVAPLALSPANLRDAVSRAIGPAPTIVRDNVDEVVICCEAEQLPLPRVASQLVADCPRAAEVAGRIHTRADVEWIALSDGT